MGRIYGYVRVSSREQNEDRQLIAMREALVPPKNIYVDKQSGKDFDRNKLFVKWVLVKKQGEKLVA